MLLALSALAVIILICVDGHKDMHDLALSFVSGMVVYVLTVVLPEKVRMKKLKRYVINELITLRREYRDLLRVIVGRPCNLSSFTMEQIQNGMERFNCRKHSDSICLSDRTVDILRPKCIRILDITSFLMTKYYAFSVEQLLVIHEITQVQFLTDIADLAPDSDYCHKKQRMIRKADYLLRRYNDLQKIYSEIKEETDRTIGRHPSS